MLSIFKLKIIGNKIRYLLFAAVIFSMALSSCDSADPMEEDEDFVYRSTFVEDSQQRTGDAVVGFEYLTTGNYVGNGIPLDVFNSLSSLLDFGTVGVLNRSGRNADLPAEFNAVQAENGVWMAAPNCLTCHAGKIDGEYIVGLGNVDQDYTIDTSALTPFIDAAIRNSHGTDSPEWQAYLPFKEATEATAPEIRLETRGVNPADRLTFVLAAHRDPTSLEWSNEPLYDLPLPAMPVPSDVPPWWLLKKKNAMFYTALGRGDFSRITMTASLLTLRDSSEAARIDEKFPDVLAYIESIEAPEFPRTINEAWADQGKVVFETNCSSCHGTYGENEFYPNLVIHKDDIGTDPALLESYSLNASFIDRYNNLSWFGTGDNASQLVVSDGYLAPPLDGIWASAPYFHNGSVPDIEGVLDSRVRPSKWVRSFNSSDYSYQKLGWIWENAGETIGSSVYDTSIPGYGNEGHLYGDNLSQQERTQLFEYLKTL